MPTPPHYVPVNEYVYAAALSGCVAGAMGSQPITSVSDETYGDTADNAVAFAEEFDTLWGVASLDVVQYEAILDSCTSYWRGRIPQSNVPSEYEAICDALITMVSEVDATAIAAGATPPAWPPAGGGGGAGFSLGMSAVGNSLFVEAGTDWTNCPAGETTTLFTLLPFVADDGEVVAGSSDLSSAEQVTIAVLIDVQNPANDDLAHFEWRMSGRSNGASVLNAQGTTAPTEITTPPEPLNEGSSLVGMTATIVVVGATLTVQVTALDSVPVLAGVSVSYVRRSPGALPPAPTLSATSANSGPAEGGTPFNLTGTNLQYVFAVNIVLPGPTTVPAEFTYNSGTGQLDCTSGATDVGGLANIEVLAPGGTATLDGAWTYDLDSFVIFGPTSHVWKNVNLVQAAGVVTGWNDQNTTIPWNMVPTGAPVYNASSATWTPAQSSVALNGTTQFFSAAVSGPASSMSIFAWAIIKITGTGAEDVGYIFEWNSAATFVLLFNGEFAGQAPAVQVASRAIPEFGSTTLDIAVAMWGFSDDASVGVGGQSQVSVNNATPVSTTGTGGITGPGPITLLIGTNGGLLTLAAEIVEVGVCPFAPGTQPTSQQLTQLQAYAAATYGI